MSLPNPINALVEGLRPKHINGIRNFIERFIRGAEPAYSIKTAQLILTALQNGQIPYADAQSLLQAIAANATGTKKFLGQTNSGVPQWDALTASDMAAMLSATNIWSAEQNFTGGIKDNGTLLSNKYAQLSGNNSMSGDNTFSGSNRFSGKHSAGNTDRWSGTFSKTAGDAILRVSNLPYGGTGAYGAIIEVSVLHSVNTSYSTPYAAVARFLYTQAASTINVYMLDQVSKYFSISAKYNTSGVVEFFLNTDAAGLVSARVFSSVNSVTFAIPASTTCSTAATQYDSALAQASFAASFAAKKFTEDGTDLANKYNPLTKICCVKKSDNQTLTNTADTVLTWDQEEIDTDSMHDTSTNNSRITIPTTGYYRVTVSTYLTAAPTAVNNALQLKVRLGGSTVVMSTFTESMITGNNYFTLQAQKILSLSANDYLEAVIYHTTGTGTCINAGSASTFFQVERIK